MNMNTTGIHHVTAISGGPQRNLDFYIGVLGLRMVKKTVNFDDPGTYHLYYGDGGGNPGSIMTFFPWANAPKGTQGTGQLTAASFSIPERSLDFWTARLAENGASFDEPETRFGNTVLPFADPDGMRLELVADSEDTREAWEDGTVPPENAVRGFHDVTLSVANPERTAEVMTKRLGFREAATENGRARYEAGDGGSGNSVDVVEGSSDSAGRMGVGTVHHVAFRVPDYETQESLREEIAALGFDVTPVLDRNYFRSIYFREPGGVLFEIATDPPGFTDDEPLDELGTNLKLPPWLESRRDRIESSLPHLDVPTKENV
ncbi:MAG: ring-cleaving dioxygenase [Actinomycetota bacterium]|nr:ring-cleaving dioxygenase [Rubrobacter sp.]MDQ3509720.1 ring-cleaving dioxygenase [Actinomycetota bacterium]